MKSTLLFCLVVLSLQGWCSAGFQTQASILSVSPVRGAVTVEQVSSANDTLQTSIIASCFLLYFAGIIWWVATVKVSLDMTLRNVLRDIAQHS